jgi:hypothetical protein
MKVTTVLHESVAPMISIITERTVEISVTMLYS